MTFIRGVAWAHGKFWAMKSTFKVGEFDYEIRWTDIRAWNGKNLTKLEQAMLTRLIEAQRKVGDSKPIEPEHFKEEPRGKWHWEMRKPMSFLRTNT